MTVMVREAWLQWYGEIYLCSSHWATVRARAIKRAGDKCQLCGTVNEPLEVHHNSYDRLGAEADSDLIALCRDCHELFHTSRRAAIFAEREAARQARYAAIGDARSVIAIRALVYLARHPGGVRYKNWIDGVLPVTEWTQTDGTVVQSQPDRNLLNCMVTGNTHYVIGVGDFVETVEKCAVIRGGRTVNIFRLTAKGRRLLAARGGE